MRSPPQLAFLTGLALCCGGADASAQVSAPTSPRTRAAAGERAPPEDPLTPLYRRISADLQQGRPLVVTVHVALCDNTIIWCGEGARGDGDAPGRNLYWGGAAGLRAYFDRARGYRRIHRDSGDGELVLERVVYRRRVRQPRGLLRRLGVSRPFDIFLVGLAYRGRHLGAATQALIEQVAQEAGQRLTLSEGAGEQERELLIGGQGHVVGYAGHNHLMDVGPYRFPAGERRQPLGYFALSCRSAPYLAEALCAGPARALLLTRTLMYPGAFTIDGLIQGLAEGAHQHDVYHRGVELYARAQGRPERLIRHAFIHDGERRFLRHFPSCKAPRRLAERDLP